MKNGRIHFLLAWSGAVVWMVLRTPAEVPVPEQPIDECAVTQKVSASIESLLYSTNTAVGTVAVSGFNSNLLVTEKRSLADTLLSGVAPEVLKPYEGSYTMSELKNSDSGASISVNSAWVYAGSNLPQVGATVSETTPHSGDYTMRGGEVFLQRPGVGVRYEKDEASGESTTFLNLKREF